MTHPSDTPLIRFVGPWSDEARVNVSGAVTAIESESLPSPPDRTSPWLCLARETDFFGTIYFAQRYQVQRVYVGYSISELVSALNETEGHGNAKAVAQE